MIIYYALINILLLLHINILVLIALFVFLFLTERRLMRFSN